MDVQQAPSESVMTYGWHFSGDVEKNKGKEIKTFQDLRHYEGKVAIFEDSDQAFSCIYIVGRYIADSNLAYAPIDKAKGIYEEKPSLPYDIVEVWSDEKKTPNRKAQVSELFYNGRYDIHQSGHIYEYV